MLEGESRNWIIALVLFRSLSLLTVFSYLAAHEVLFPGGWVFFFVFFLMLFNFTSPPVRLTAHYRDLAVQQPCQQQTISPCTHLPVSPTVEGSVYKVREQQDTVWHSVYLKLICRHND